MLLCILFFRLFTVLPSAEQQLAACFGRQVVVQGAVEPLSLRSQDGFSSAVLRCEKVYSDTELAYSGRLRVSVKGELPQAGCVVLKGTLEQLDSLRNPGGFDAASYNRVQELGGRLRKAQLLKIEPQVLWWQRFALWNKKLSERIEATGGAEYGALLSGMVLGGSSRLDEETRELFTDNGLAIFFLFRARILCCSQACCLLCCSGGRCHGVRLLLSFCWLPMLCSAACVLRCCGRWL